jgi:uncharacterized repeat protein (TIGR01451 family)
MWNIGALADGQEGSIRLVLRSDAATANNTTVINQSQISTTTTDRDSANNRSDAPTLIVTRSDLAVVKTAPPRVTAGENVQYNLSYRNNGPSVARDAVLRDTLPTDLDFVSANPAPTSNVNGVLTWNVGDLQPNQSGIITVQMRSRIDQTVASLTVTNTLQIKSPTEDPTPDNNTSTVTTHVETVNVSVIKHSPPYIVAGLPFTITLAYANAGPATARGVTLRDLLPSGLTVVSSNPPATGPGLRWNLGDLAGGTSGSIEVVLRAPTTAISGTTYTNVAVIDSPTSPDRDPSDDTSSTVSTVRPNSDLEIVKSGPVAPMRSGSPVSYTLSYRNRGPSQALNVRIEDTLPAGFTFRSATPAPTTSANGVLAWDIGTLDANASGSITVNGMLMGEGVTTTRTNTATISSPTTPDPTPGNNSSTVDTTVQKPDLNITKTDNVTQVRPGDTLTYEITVQNTGTAVATGVLLRETPPAGVTVLSPDWTAQSDGTYTLQIGDLAAGQRVTRQFILVLPNPLPVGMTSVVNTVTVTDDGSEGTDPTPDNNISTDTDTPMTGRIGDTVWYDKDGDGQQDDGEVGLGNVVVRLLDPSTNQVLATTSTDPHGHYMFTGLRMGSYAVSLAPEATTTGVLRGYRYTTALTPVGTITDSNSDNMAFDIGLNNPGSTDVVLAYVRAERGEGGVVTVTWLTVEEVNTSRFRVLRSVTNDIVQATEVAVVTSKGSTGGAYAISDTDAPIRAVYWLQEIERGGNVMSYGPFTQQSPTVTAGDGTVRIHVPLVMQS